MNTRKTAATVLASIVALGSASPAAAAPGGEIERTHPESTAETETHGARFQAGAFVMGHARTPDMLHSASTAFAPGLALGVGWRLGAWELDLVARAAYDRSDTFSMFPRSTLFGAAGGRACWFIQPGASLTPFIELGADAMVFMVDSAGGLGPSAHLGAGFEIRHDEAHHRLRVGVGVDTPAFRLARTRSESGSSGSSWFSSDAHIYVVPVSLVANWTF